MNISEWTVEYVKFRDVMKKEISGIETKDNKVIVHKKNSDNIYLTFESLTPSVQFEENTIVVMHNSTVNIDIVIDKWKEILQLEKIQFIFVNIPANDKWILHPHMHERITENLKESLYSLHDTVGEY